MSSKGLHPQRKRVRFWILLFAFALVLAFKAVPWDKFDGSGLVPRQASAQAAKDDYSGDGIIDLLDLEIFSWKRLKIFWQDVDWCSWLDGNHREKKYMGSMLEAFVREYFQCGAGSGEDPLLVKHSLVYPMRLALGPGGNLYVTDPKTGSVFIHDVDFNIIGELKELDKPLGLAVDDQGNIYVGNNGRRNVEIYDAGGVKTATIGQGLIKMPNDLTFDKDGRLYVADSKKDTIWVFGSNGAVIRSIGTPGEGDGQFKFPIAVEIAYYIDGQTGLDVGELYVADHGHSLIQVFDLDGNFLRSFGGTVRQSMMGGWKWQGKFVSLQSLAFDGQGQLHALDCYMDNVQIFDPVAGSSSSYYGQKGTEPGQLNLPSDIIIDGLGQVIVAESRNKRVEIIYTIP